MVFGFLLNKTTFFYRQYPSYLHHMTWLRYVLLIKCLQMSKHEQMRWDKVQPEVSLWWKKKTRWRGNFWRKKKTYWLLLTKFGENTRQNLNNGKRLVNTQTLCDILCRQPVLGVWWGLLCRLELKLCLLVLVLWLLVVLMVVHWELIGVLGMCSLATHRSKGIRGRRGVVLWSNGEGGGCFFFVCGGSWIFRCWFGLLDMNNKNTILSNKRWYLEYSTLCV